MYTFGAIGLGNMGLCILDGAVKSGAVKPASVIIFDPSPERLDLAKKRGFAGAQDEAHVYENCDFLLLAVIPQLYAKVLEKLRNCVARPEQTIITIAAGITSAFIQQYVGKDKKIIRVMPNTPLMLGCGASALSKTPSVTDEAFAKVETIFKSVGITALISENLMTEIVPANGSTPAFIYYFIDCIARAVEKHGIDRDLALKLIAQTFAGAAQMVLQSDKSPQELIEQVSSPGGMTIEAIKVFDKRALCSIIDEACTACIARGYELAK